MLPQVDAAASTQLAKALSLHPLAAQVLLNRGLSSPEAIVDFLKDGLAELPDPFTMKGMEAAVARLARALTLGEPITLYGDYDVDGVCSTALMSLFLESLGGKVRTYIPHRVAEGYGLNVGAVERLAQERTRVLVTLDCGITAGAEIARANALGMDVVVVDHHHVPEVMPPALAILNPQQPGCGYPTRHLCAAGVAFNLCMGLRKRLREEGSFQSRPEPLLKGLLDLVALATVADVVPLTGANRILVKHGLAELGRGLRPGVRALKEVAGMGAEESVSAGQVGFRLGPRINAAGRLHDASLGLQLLRSGSLEEARPFAQALDEANAERQKVEQKIQTEAMAQAEALGDRRGLVLSSESWHPGVIGIVASRVVEKFHRPTVLVAVKDGVGKGSGRSIEGFHLVNALDECATHLVRYGGHKAAAGVTVDAQSLPAFREAFERVAANHLKDEDLVPRCRVDAVVSRDQLTEEAVHGLARLGPFGMGNPEPVLMARRQVTRPRVLARKNGDGPGHLKLFLEGSGVSAMGFGMADRAGLTEGPLDLAFNLALDTWKGVPQVSLKLKALRVAE
jgi:single-stranded-DNA-specific exonuclease